MYITVEEERNNTQTNVTDIQYIISFIKVSEYERIITKLDDKSRLGLLRCIINTWLIKVFIIQEKLSLQLYSINGNHLASETVYVPIQDMLTADGHLIFGNLQGVLVIKQLFGLVSKLNKHLILF